MAVVPSLSALLVPKIEPPLPVPMIFSTLSEIASIFAPGKQTTMSSPLLRALSVFLLNLPSPINTLALILTPPPHHYLRVAFVSDPFHCILPCSHVTWQHVVHLFLAHQHVIFPFRLRYLALLVPSFLSPSLPSPPFPSTSLPSILLLSPSFPSPSLPFLSAPSPYISFRPVSFRPVTVPPLSLLPG